MAHKYQSKKTDYGIPMGHTKSVIWAHYYFLGRIRLREPGIFFSGTSLADFI